MGGGNVAVGHGDWGLRHDFWLACAISVKWFNLFLAGWQGASLEGKLHLSLILPPFIDTLKLLQADFIWWAGNRGKGGFHVHNAPRQSAWVLEDTKLFTNDVPREYSKVFPSSHPGNRCWQKFYWFLYLPLNPPTQLLSLFASAIWLMEHFSVASSCTELSRDNRADSGNSQVGTWHCFWQAETE